MQVHPAYDTEARVWFTDEGLTAKTLAELQRKLPKAQIVGYYPNGYGTPVKTQIKTPLTVPLVPPLVMRQLVPVQKQGVQPRIRPRTPPSLFEEPTFQDEPLKEFPPVPFTAKGPITADLPGLAPKFEKAEINEAPLHKVQPPSPVLQKVPEAESTQQREVVSPVQGPAGHSPGVTQLAPTPKKRHYSGNREYVYPPRKWLPEDKTELRELVAKGWGDVQIAKHIKRSRNAVIGERHRQKLFLNL